MKTFLIICLIIISFITGYLINDSKDSSPVVEIIPGDTIFTIINKDSLIPYKEIDYDTITKYDTIWKDIDTATIIAEYLKTRIYLDTIIDDTSMTVIIRDSLSRNMLLNRISKLKNNRETKIINNYSYNQNGFYLGGELGLKHISIEADYIYKSNIFELGIKNINFDNKSFLYPSIGYKRKLNIGK